MALNLMSVAGLIAGARTLLLDKVQPYRYDDPSLVAALNLALLEGRRVRPDLFINRQHQIDVAQFDAVSGEDIGVEPQFRLAFEYGTAGHALLRDQEDVQDERATTFLRAMQDILVGVRQSSISGGTPSPSKAKGGQGGNSNSQG